MPHTPFSWDRHECWISAGIRQEHYIKPRWIYLSPARLWWISLIIHLLHQVNSRCPKVTKGFFFFSFPKEDRCFLSYSVSREMSEQAKTEMSCGAPWFPLRKWWLPSRLLSRDLGLPPFLEPGDPRWMDAERLQRSLALYSWPGYVPAPLFVPYVSESMPEPGQKIRKWRVSLDVAHFSTSEISIIIREGFLEVGGTALLVLQQHCQMIKY